MFSASSIESRQAGAQEMLSLRPGKHGGRQNQHGTPTRVALGGQLSPGETRVPCCDVLPQETVLRPGALGREAVHGQATSPLASAVFQALQSPTLSLPRWRALPALVLGEWLLSVPSSPVPSDQ